MLELAKILKPHGLKGEMKISPIFEDINYKKLNKVYVGKKLIESNVQSVSNLNGFYGIKLDICKSIEEAESFRNQIIYIDREDYSELLKDIIILDDLVGINVVDENEEVIGVVVCVDEYGAAPVLTINELGVSYQLPLTRDFVTYNKEKNFLQVNRETYLGVRV